MISLQGERLTPLFRTQSKNIFRTRPYFVRLTCISTRSDYSLFHTNFKHQSRRRTHSLSFARRMTVFIMSSLEELPCLRLKSAENGTNWQKKEVERTNPPHQHLSPGSSSHQRTHALPLVPPCLEVEPTPCYGLGYHNMPIYVGIDHPSSGHHSFPPLWPVGSKAPWTRRRQLSSILPATAARPAA